MSGCQHHPRELDVRIGDGLRQGVDGNQLHHHDVDGGAAGVFLSRRDRGSIQRGGGGGGVSLSRGVRSSILR